MKNFNEINLHSIAAHFKTEATQKQYKIRNYNIQNKCTQNILNCRIPFRKTSSCVDGFFDKDNEETLSLILKTILLFIESKQCFKMYFINWSNQPHEQETKFCTSVFYLIFSVLSQSRRKINRKCFLGCSQTGTIVEENSHLELLQC